MEANEAAGGRRRLAIDFEAMRALLTSRDSFTYYFLNLETGEIERVSEEVAVAADQLLVDLPEGIHLTSEMIDLMAGQANIRDDQAREFRVVVAAETAPAGRFAAIAMRSPDAALRDMEEFADSVDDAVLREHLLDALDQPSPSSAFHHVLLDLPDERQRWLNFQDARLREHIASWLDERGIDPQYS